MYDDLRSRVTYTGCHGIAISGLPGWIPVQVNEPNLTFLYLILSCIGVFAVPSLFTVSITQVLYLSAYNGTRATWCCIIFIYIIT